MPRQPRSTHHIRYLLVFYSLLYSNYTIPATILQVNRAMARYWTHKYIRQDFHPKKHGGIRRATFCKNELEIVQGVLISVLRVFPYIDLVGLVQFLCIYFYRHVTRSVVQRLLKKLRWSWRIPTKVQINKFSQQNLLRYAVYIDSIQSIPWDKLKFMDEAHIVSRSLSKKKVLGVVNQRTWVPSSDLHV